MSYYDDIRSCAAVLAQKIGRKPRLALVLGSGLGSFAEKLERAVEVEYRVLPGFPVSTVAGHAGRFVCGEVAGVEVLAMQGRFHYYEGYTMQQVTMPIRVMHELGVKRLVVSNASGGVNPAFRPGDIMLISDYINMMPNPLIGPNEDAWGVRFPSMHDAFSEELRGLAKEAAQEVGDMIVEGCYLGTTGPSFETPHEYNFFRVIGADAVGMSTVPEVIVARHCGIEVVGLSLISNVGGLHRCVAVSHEEVQAEGARAAERFGRIVGALIPKLGRL